MSKNEVLYVKGMNVQFFDFPLQTESDSGMQHGDDMWDDSQLNSAYDKALKMANVEVAKRVAMTTNSKSPPVTKEGSSKSTKAHKTKSKLSKKKSVWSAGMPCRAFYEGDGLEYEAFVIRQLNDRECLVRFIGYNNSEIVEMVSLKPSLGKEAQSLQIEQALAERENESVYSQSFKTDTEADSEQHSQGSTERSFSGKDRKKKKGHHLTNGFFLPGMLPMPDLSKLRNIGSMEVPMPPPPLPFPSSDPECEDQAISSMLLSWYMSGYYTGLYQGLKRAKMHKKHTE
ncbi:survival motor neuron protein isoform X2 [Pectinophora gossypiella]|uniref:survival motor neuron protein isoform X2 n=1 Tax=Pectinophora gossypiella TaxID=13191 RepID=UPI00214F48AE|nr:survival motor neuron protein isoform X2 [Pectinophora gossypiella]